MNAPSLVVLLLRLLGQLDPVHLRPLRPSAASAAAAAVAVRAAARRGSLGGFLRQRRPQF